MNPKRTVARLAVIGTTAIAIPLGAGSTANAAETHPTPATAGPMATAFNTAAHTGTARTKNSSRIDCDDSGENFGDYLGGYAAAEGGDGTVADASGGGPSVAQGAFVGALSGAMTGAATALANNMLNAAAHGIAPENNASPTAFD